MLCVSLRKSKVVFFKLGIMLYTCAVSTNETTYLEITPNLQLANQKPCLSAVIIYFLRYQVTVLIRILSFFTEFGFGKYFYLFGTVRQHVWTRHGYFGSSRNIRSMTCPNSPDMPT